MNIIKMFKQQIDYPFGFEAIQTTDIPVTTIYLWRYIIIIHPSMYTLLEEYIGEHSEDFESNLSYPVESTISKDVKVFDVSNSHHTHINSPTVVQLLSDFVDAKQREIMKHVEVV